MMLTKAQEDAIENAGWGIYENADGYEFESASPAGEDIIVWLPKDEDPISYLYDYWQGFNPDEHAAGWYGQNRGEPSSLRDLLDDAECIKDMLEELCECVRDAKLNAGKSASKCTKPYCKPKATKKKAPSKAKKPVKAPAKRRK